MSPREIDKVLRGLPIDDRISALIINLCSRNVDAIATVGGLIATMGIVSQNLVDARDRLVVATALRDCATTVEHEHVPLVKE